MSRVSKSLKWDGGAIAAFVFLEEIIYFFGHRRAGPSLVIALLALAVALLFLSDLMQVWG